MDVAYKNKIDRILEAHEAWLKSKGNAGKPADFSGMQLAGVDFSEKDLSHASFDRADLYSANFYGSILIGASFTQASLRSVCFTKSKAIMANFIGSRLEYSSFANADLTAAAFERADLTYVNFEHADLVNVNFAMAYFNGTSMRGANLNGGIFHHVWLDRVPFLNVLDTSVLELVSPLCCPEEGAFIGWKRLANDRIAKLVITEDAKRSSAFGRKCRASKVLVVKITSVDGSKEFDYGVSMYDPSFIYNVGSFATVFDFDDDRFRECASGIHFFITRQEAVNYDD